MTTDVLLGSEIPWLVREVSVKVLECVSSSYKVVKGFSGVIFRSILKRPDQVVSFTQIHTRVEDLLYLIVIPSVNFDQRGRVMALIWESIRVVVFEESDVEDG
ncbi:hypothetical protein C0995_001935, partial [Termitomyces sp. Mi166